MDVFSQKKKKHLTSILSLDDRLHSAIHFHYDGYLTYSSCYTPPPLLPMEQFWTALDESGIQVVGFDAEGEKLTPTACSLAFADKEGVAYVGMFLLN